MFATFFDRREHGEESVAKYRYRGANDMKTILVVILFCGYPVLASAQTAFAALLADGPAAQYREKLMLFGQFVGDWDFDGIEYHADGSRVTDKGEIEFGWVLGGRAVQDVWIERERSDGHVKTYGTTLRVYDPKMDAWRIIWVDPPTGALQTMVARKVGDQIVLEGKDPDGIAIRWIFSEIKPDSFHWRAERLTGASWRVYEECFPHRLKTTQPPWLLPSHQPPSDDH